MVIDVVFVISTKEILYSRSRHDYRMSEDSSVSIDGGREYTRIDDRFKIMKCSKQ